MKLFLQKKMQNFRALRAPPPDPRAPAAGSFAPKPPASPHWPPVAGGSAPRPPTQSPHCEFLATRLVVRSRLELELAVQTSHIKLKHAHSIVDER